MKAIVQNGYGSSDVLELRDIDKPLADDNEVLVRVRAASVNPADWHFMKGLPYMFRMVFGLRKPRVKVRGRTLRDRLKRLGRT